MDKLLIQLAGLLTPGPGDNQVNIPTTASGEGLSADMVLANGLNLVYFLAGAVAVIVIIVGGILFATSAGNAANVTKAKNMILYAVVGLVIVLAAFAITNFVNGRFS